MLFAFAHITLSGRQSSPSHNPILHHERHDPSCTPLSSSWPTIRTTPNPVGMTAFRIGRQVRLLAHLLVAWQCALWQVVSRTAPSPTASIDDKVEQGNLASHKQQLPRALPRRLIQPTVRLLLGALDLRERVGDRPTSNWTKCGDARDLADPRASHGSTARFAATAVLVRASAAIALQLTDLPFRVWLFHASLHTCTSI